jgi:hypothetical protein
MATVATTGQTRFRLPSVARPVGEWHISRAAVTAFAAFAGLASLVVLAEVFSLLPIKLPPASAPIAATAAPSPSATPESTSSPAPQPSASSSLVSVRNFEEPFTYEVPPGVDLSLARSGPKLVSLNSSNFPTDAPEIADTISDLYPTGSSGIVFASVVGAGMDSCPRHIGGQPIYPGADVPTLLTNYAGFTFTTTPTTVGGLPATVSSDISIDAPCLDHLHIAGNYTDVGSTMLLDKSQEKVHFVPIGDATLLIQTWGTADWVPVADQIVESIAFTGQPPEPTERPLSSESESYFVKPFVYRLPDGVLLATQERTHSFVSFFASPYTSDGNGISIASSADGLLDGCPQNSAMIDVGPADDFVSLLRNKAGLDFDETPTMIGGRPATLVRNVTTTCYGHLHVGQSFLAQVGQLNLGQPFEQVYLLPFADTTVVIQVWSGSKDLFDAWLPIAKQIVEGMHFSGE